MADVHTIHTTHASHVDHYRYSIYWSPPASSPLASLGAGWLGRDAETGTEYPLPEVDGLTKGQMHDVVRRPAHYGLHATLKSPFRLKDAQSGRRLFDRVARFASNQPSFELPKFELVYRNGFFYLQPGTRCGAINTLANACVHDFDDLRAPLNDADIARRRMNELTERERGYVREWGYPYVFEKYDMHLTLTSRLDDALVDRVQVALKAISNCWSEPSVVDSVCIFAQQNPDDDFRLLERFSFSDAKPR